MDIRDRIWEKFKIRDGDIVPFCVRRGRRDSLVDLFAEAGYKVGAEVGVFEGIFSEFMIQKIPDLKLYCIDPWEPCDNYDHSEKMARISYKNAMHRFKKYPDNVTILRTNSIDASKQIEDKSLDFVYIDGNHRFDYVCTDLIYWSRKVKIGGIMSGHDYCKHYRQGVMPAVDAYTKCHNIHEWFITKEEHPSWFWVMNESIYRDCCFE